MKALTLTTFALLLTQAALAQSPKQPESAPYLLQIIPSTESDCFSDLRRAQAVLLNADGSYHGTWQPQSGVLVPFTHLPSSSLSPQAQKISANWYVLQQLVPPKTLRQSGCLKTDAIVGGKIKLGVKLDVYTAEGQKVLPESIVVPDILKESEAIGQMQNALAARYPEFSQDQGEIARTNADEAFLQAQGLSVDTGFIGWKRDFAYGTVHGASGIIGFINRNYGWTLGPAEIKRRGYRDLLFSYVYDDEQYYRFARTDKPQCFGLLDDTGKERLPAQYSYAFKFKEGKHVIAADCDTGVSVLLELETGKRVYEMPQKYAHLRFETFPDQQGHAFVSLDGASARFGSLNVHTGQLVLPVQFTELTEFNERGEAQAVRAGTNQEGLIGRDGKWTVAPQSSPKFARVLPLPHSDWLEWSNNLDESQNGLPTYYYSQRQDTQPPHKTSPFADQGIDLLHGFDEQGYGLARKIDPDPVKMLQQEGFVNPQGQWLIAPNYTFSPCQPDEQLSSCARRKNIHHPNASRVDDGARTISHFNAHNLIIAQQNGQFGVLNRAGQAVVPFAYDQITLPGQQQFMTAQKNGITYVLDLRGNVLHEFSGSHYEH